MTSDMQQEFSELKVDREICQTKEETIMDKHGKIYVPVLVDSRQYQVYFPQLPRSYWVSQIT
jgi:hypothetical protein